MNKKKRASKTQKRVIVIILFLISLIFVATAASFATIGFSYLENRSFTETFYSVGSLKVNNKIRIIQISDLHDCAYGDNNSNIIDRVGKLKPDIIILTGDIIDTNSATEDDVIALCTELAKIAPSFYVYGNNEVERYYGYALTEEKLDAELGFDNTNRDPNKLLEIGDPFAEKLEDAGVVVLKNSVATVTVGDTNVDVYGVLTSNPSSFWSYAGDSFDDFIYTNEKNLKIMAIHEPLIFEEFTPDSWGDLMLAGHTHGGLAKIPMVGALYTPEGGFLPERGAHYVSGRYEVQGRPLIVNSGLDNSDIFRVNNQPEIVIVDINKF